jgi:hypothetical protein
MKVKMMLQNNYYSKLAIYNACNNLLKPFYFYHGKKFHTFNKFLIKMQNKKMYAYDSVICDGIYCNYSIGRNGHFFWEIKNSETLTIARKDNFFFVTINYDNLPTCQYEFMKLINFNSLLLFASSINLEK